MAFHPSFLCMYNVRHSAPCFSQPCLEPYAYLCFFARNGCYAYLCFFARNGCYIIWYNNISPLYKTNVTIICNLMLFHKESSVFPLLYHIKNIKYCIRRKPVSSHKEEESHQNRASRRLAPLIGFFFRFYNFICIARNTAPCTGENMGRFRIPLFSSTIFRKTGSTNSSAWNSPPEKDTITGSPPQSLLAMHPAINSQKIFHRRLLCYRLRFPAPPD